MRGPALAAALMIGGCLPPIPAPTDVPVEDSAAPADSDTRPDTDAPVDPGPPAVDYVIVHADAFAEAAARYASFRAAGGRTVQVFSVGSLVADGADPLPAVREALRPLYDARDPERPFDVFVIGDAVRDTVSADTVPAPLYTDPFTSDTAYSDNGYVDFDGDELPDAGIGRLPADTAEQVDAYRARVEAFEAVYRPGPWNARVNVFASTSGFGPVEDVVIEQQAAKIIGEAPEGLDVSMTYAKQSSPYVYVPEQFSAKVYERFNEGARLFAYIGHGFPDGFATLEWGDAEYPILDVADLAPLAVQNRSPVVAFVACSLGKYAVGDSVAEDMVLHSGGPVALLASATVSHPVPNALFIRELGQVMTVEQPVSVGQAQVRAKERLVNNTDPLHLEIAALAQLFIPDDEFAALLLSHQHYYALFGDPGARLDYPVAAAIDAPAVAVRGGTTTVSATFPGLSAGTAEFSLLSLRAEILGDLSAVPADGDPNRDAVIAANYATANDKRVVSVSVASNGTATADLAIPSDIPRGDYRIAVYASDSARDAVGGVTVQVR